MALGTGISKEDLFDGVLLFAVLHEKPTFSARECTAFLQTQAINLDEELTNELILELVERNELRELGPGVYSKQAKAPVPLQQPVFPEERQR